MKIVRATETCPACPTQWDAWDANGSYVYMRYRFGRGTAEVQPSQDVDTWTWPKVPEKSFRWCDCGWEHGNGRACYAGTISLEKFCELADIELALSDVEPSGTR